MSDTMKALKIIAKTREYLDYLEEHILNVQKAWKELHDKCSGKGSLILADDFDYFRIDALIKAHDVSKLGEYELVQYRKKFFPVDGEMPEPEEIVGAIQHHYNHNPHHWENWTQNKDKSDVNYLNCITMVVDWMAMGYKFGDTAQAYYEKNKKKIDLPKWAVDRIYEIFDILKVSDE